MQNCLYGLFHAEDDAVASVSYTRAAITGINNAKPAVKPLLTIWPNERTYSMDRVYADTSYKYDGSIEYIRMVLGQNKSLPVNKLPVAKASTNNITTGTGIATLNASSSTDADGKIVRYVWKKIAGPSAGIITNAFGPNSSNTTVTGLTVAGTYTYVLAVVDDRAGFNKRYHH